jgi:hypothetical protein
LLNNELLASPTRRYATRVTPLLKRQNAELLVIRKELQEHKEILQRRKTHKNGKRIKLQGEFVFNTADILKIARDSEEKPVEKRPRGRPRKRPIDEVEEEEEEEEEVILSSSANSDSELEEVVTSRTRSKKQK